MPDQTLDQLPEEIVPSDADLLYVVRNGADRKILRGALVDGLAPETRSILTAGGLSGGGDLSANRTLALDLAGLPEDTAPDPGADYVVTQDASAGVPRRVRIDRLPASGTGSAQATFASVAVPGQSTVTATQAGQTLTLSNGANVAITTNATTNTVTVAATGLVPATRSVSAGAGLAGGGTLAADRAVSLNIAGQSEDVAPVLANHYLITHDTAAGAFRRIRASLLGGGTYVLPAATSSVLGGVRVGAGLSVDVNGLLAATYALPTATASVLGGVKVGPGLAIDGTGILSATGGGGGGGGGTFATQAEAEAGTSTTTYMSPARTREALTSYAAANELTGTDGQVVRFNAAGDAVAANNTRAVMVPVFAESAAVATGTAIRKFRWPVGLRLTQVEVYTPTPGSTATAVDVAVGSSIFNAPPSVAGGSSATTVTAFAQATVAKAAVCEISVTAAGTGARGLWVTFTGIET